MAEEKLECTLTLDEFLKAEPYTSYVDLEDPENGDFDLQHLRYDNYGRYLEFDGACIPDIESELSFINKVAGFHAMDLMMKYLKNALQKCRYLRQV